MTPTPFATALRGLLDFAREVVRSKEPGSRCWSCGQYAGHPTDCIVGSGERALAAWESRGPLGDDEAARAAVRAAMHEGAGCGWSVDRKLDNYLDAVDRALTGERGP